MGKAEEFRKEREAMNSIILESGGSEIKRFFNLDTKVYKEGALDEKTKELMGLVASLVMRCDDCISYHMLRCMECGVNSREFEEAMSIGLVVGGSITIPHMRRAFKLWKEINEDAKNI